MSWHGGTGICNAVIAALIVEVQVKKTITHEVAADILTPIIAELRQNDWGDPEECLWNHNEHQFVVQAFERNGIVEDEACGDCGQEPDDYCAECNECECFCVCGEDEEEGDDEGSAENTSVN